MKTHSLLVLSLTCAACGAQVDSDYDGDVIASLRAEVAAAPEGDAPALEAAIWWTGVARGLLDRVEVSGEFPAPVTLELTQPPADDVLIAIHGPRFACEPLVLVGRDDDWGDTGPSAEDGAGGIYGVTERNVVCYMRDPIVAGSATATLLGGAYEPGYHVVTLEHRVRWYEAEAQGTSAEYEEAHQRCLADFEALHPGAENAAVYYCSSDIAHPSDEDLETVMSITTGEFVFPEFHLDT